MDDDFEARCKLIYDALINGARNDPATIFGLVECFGKGFDVTFLRKMLESNDLDVVNDGLFIASELRAIDGSVLELIRKLSSHSDSQIARFAREIVNERRLPPT